MELKDSHGNLLVTEVEYKCILEARALFPILRSSMSKTWRLIDKVIKVLDNSVSAKAA